MRNCNYCKNNKYCIALKTSRIDVRLAVEKGPLIESPVLFIAIYNAQCKLGRDMATDCEKYKSILFEESK